MKWTTLRHSLFLRFAFHANRKYADEQKRSESWARNILPVALSQKYVIRYWLLLRRHHHQQLHYAVRINQSWYFITRKRVGGIVWARAPLIWKLLDEGALRCASRKCFSQPPRDSESAAAAMGMGRRQFSANIVFVRALSILGGKDCLFMSASAFCGSAPFICALNTHESSKYDMIERDISFCGKRQLTSLFCVCVALMEIHNMSCDMLISIYIYIQRGLECREF